jgi:glycosyltransferase involved in cell wall biosynthesis
VSLEEILSDNEKFASMWREDVKNHVLAERLTADNLEEFESQNARAFEVGVSRGLSKKHKLLSVDRCNRGEFLKFQTIGNAASKAIVLVSQFFPPDQEGGIPTLTKELSESLAAEGNIVHVVTQSADINRVDLENGVWIHRVLNTDHELNEKACSLNIPQRIWNWSATAHSEVKRISEHREISVVEAPVWDCQGIAFLLNRQWPLITSLQTTLHFWLDTHDELRNDSDWMTAFGSPMLRLEKMLMMNSDGIRSISAAIKCDVESAYSFAFDDSNVQTSPLGMSPEQFPRKNEKRNNNLKLLFVGRLEPRKGIDVLLSAILIILKNNANVNFQIIGDDSIQVPGKQITYKNEFLASQLGKQFSNRVSFEGRVDDLTLRAAYRDCDVFISPSRFESFGLVFLEAMREAKPVIGCNVGGMPEIISDKKSGLLVTPGNIDELASAIQDLIDSPKMRKKMGENGRAIFLEKFTAEVMARSSLPLYEMAQRNYGMKFK